QTPGLSDVKTYASIVTGTATVDAGDRYRRFRVLVPWLARPFYWLARGRVGTWDPVMFGLLVADSLFVAGTAVLIVILGSRELGSSAAGLVGALLYLVNFAVPGALTKESFIPFSIVFMSAWWVSTRGDRNDDRKHFPDAAWILTS